MTPIKVCKTFIQRFESAPRLHPKVIENKVFKNSAKELRAYSSKIFKSIGKRRKDGEDRTKA